MMWIPQIETALLQLSRTAPKRFIVLMVVLMFAFKTPFVPLILALGGSDIAGKTAAGGLAMVLFSFLFLPVETLIGQALPLWALRKIGVSRLLPLCLWSAGIFGLFHLLAGPGAFFVGFAGGLALSLCWQVLRPDSFLKAFLGTTLVHILHNTLGFLCYLLLRS